MLGVHPTRVYVHQCVGGDSAQIFDTTRAFSLLKKDVTDNPLFDRIICLLDQFISKETDQHWFILRKTSPKMQSCTRLCSLFSQTANTFLKFVECIIIVHTIFLLRVLDQYSFHLTAAHNNYYYQLINHLCVENLSLYPHT